MGIIRIDFVTPPVARYRCRSGHEASQPLYITFSTDLPEYKEVVTDCCPLCLSEELKRLAVPMEKE